MKRIDHIGIVVPNLDFMTPLLGKIFGLSSDEPVELPEQDVVVQFWYAGDTAIELLAPISMKSSLHRFLEKRGPGLHHICFEVDNIQDELNRYASVGLRLVDRAPWQSPHGLAAYLHPEAGNGVSIELRQYNESTK
jgi:methylmalonyl-CoA/ethylmalonyl-CoA epimerase